MSSESASIRPLHRPGAGIRDREDRDREDEAAPGAAVLEPLWREALGSRLRLLRSERQETLAQTAERAGLSPQYLSEIERGRKEASSEMIAALAGALGTTVADLMSDTADDLRRAAATVITLAGASSVLRGTASHPGAMAGRPGSAGLGLASPLHRPAGPVALASAA